MNKLIAGICTTLLMVSCGNDMEKKAAERLNKMRAEKSNTAEEDPFCL